MWVRTITTNGKDVDVWKPLLPIMKNKKSPWQAYALLEGATLAAQDEKDFTKARGYLKQVLDKPDLPDSLYAKAHALDEVYALNQNKTDKE
jgi:hypothetical protein